jgi:DNA-binding transcriptional MerR regulator
MKEQEYLTVPQIERETRIAESTLRRYVRQHGHRMNIKKNGKTYLIARESVETIRKIRALYDKGQTAEQVDKILADEGAPLTVDVPNEDGAAVPVSVAEALAGMRDEVKAMREGMDELKEHNAALAKKIDEQNELIIQQMKQRDEKLTEALRMAVEKADKQQHAGFFGRIFKR